ncbi:MAG: ABC transporter ATP-binding protein [Cohaesibacter sp.]|nr:ABC transporter ATP-binding protein [Cohaesibacter sp.]
MSQSSNTKADETDIPLLDIKHLNAGYQSKSILKDITISALKAGTITTLIGPNGAGKSTLLKALAGLIPANGNIQLGGRTLTSLGIKDRAKILSYLPQSPLAELDLSLLESLLYSARIKNEATDNPLIMPELEQAALQVLEKLDLQDLALSNLSALSGGQRQMASFAQAALGTELSGTKGHLFMLDEPTSALDLRRQEQLMQSLQTLAKEGCIIMLVLHDLSLASRYSDRLIVLDKGTLVADGSPEHVLTPKLLRSLYGVETKITRSETGKVNMTITGLANDQTKES